MKTIKRLLVVAIMLTMVTGYANENANDVSAKVITVLKFSDVNKGHQYTIIDNEGVVLFKETIERNGSFSKKFDFTALNEGSYTVELEKDFEIIVTPFIIQSKNVVFLDSKVTTVFKPVVRSRDNQLLVSQMSLNEQPLKIELYYNDELILKDELKGKSVLSQVYRLSANEKGDYYVRLESGKRVYKKSFEIK